MILLGLSGKRRTGKTTVANELAAHYAWNHYSLASTLKREVRELYGLTWDHTDGALKETPSEALGGKTPRQIMCEYGAMKRQLDPAYWINRLADDILLRHQAQFQWAVISDVRFRNEADWIKKHGGYIVRLNRSEEFTGANIDDISETELDSYPAFDMVFGASSNVDMEDVPSIAHKIMLHVVNHNASISV
jgi:hypothetical protein